MKKNAKSAVPPPIDNRTALHALLARVADAIVRQQLKINQQVEPGRHTAGSLITDQQEHLPHAE